MKFVLIFLGIFFTSQLIAQCTGSEPAVDLGPDTVLCQGTSLTLNAPAGFNYYSWSTGTTGNSIVVTTDGTYSLDAVITGTNLVLNGNFQGGTTAAANNFTSSYAPGSGGSWGLLSNPGQYAISTSPNLTHTNFMNCGDHTSGTGNMLIANGASTANTTVWTQTVTVTPGTDYLFSFWEMNVLNDPAVSNLQLYINGVAISAVVPTPATGCSWVVNDGTWNSGASTSAILSIVNQSTASSGNDFAIDDIFFAPVCVVTDSINVVYDTVQVNAGSDITFCANEPEILTASSSVAITDYTWSNGNQGAVATPLTTGTYTVTGTSVNGCVDSDDAQVTIIAMDWNISQILTGPTDCGASTGYVSVMTSGTFQDPPTYTWSGPGAGSPNFINASVFSSLSTGWYYLTIESNGCFRYDSAQVVPNNPPIAQLNAAPTSGIWPLAVNLTNTSQNGNSYYWDFGNGNTATVPDLTGQYQIYDTTGVYMVMLVAINGNCTDTAYVTITVNEPPVIPPVVPVSLETSNVFSPNNDGVNEVFSFKLENITTLDVTVLNRWGQVVYESSGANFSWDGKTADGVVVEAGVYFYTYKATGAQQENFEGHGFLHLVR